MRSFGLSSYRISRNFFPEILNVAFDLAQKSCCLTSYPFIMHSEQIKLRLEAPWEEVKERMKDNDANLTDADLEYIPGHEEELLQRLEKVMSKPRQQIIAYIESISANTDRAN